MPEQQNYKNHVRLDPIFLSAMLVLLLNIIFTIYLAVHAWSLEPSTRFLHIWLVVVSIALLLVAAKVRRYPLMAQDRIIRLEERLRYALLLTAAQLERADTLTLHQVVALRFASDAELPGLAERAVAEQLTPKQIKQSIVSWRPDHTRV